MVKRRLRPVRQIAAVTLLVAAILTAQPPAVAQSNYDLSSNPNSHRVVTADSSSQRPLGSSRVWDLSTDYSRTPSLNPGPDSYGNKSVWSYLQSTSSAHDGDYTQLSNFTRSYFGLPGLDAWAGDTTVCGGDLLPAVAINTTAHTLKACTLSIAPGTVHVHPWAHMVIVGWKSPITGTVTLSGGVTSEDPNGGNGIGWSVDRGSQILASGSYGRGGRASFPNGLTADMIAGQSLYAVVDANGDMSFDSTRLDLTITAGAGSGAVVSAASCPPIAVDKGNVVVGQKLTFNLCGPFANAASVAVSVNGIPILTVTAAIGVVMVTLNIISQTVAGVDDSARSAITCGSNVVAATGPAVTGTVSASGSFRLLCTTATTAPELALTGRHTFRSLLMAVGLILLGYFMVAGRRRPTEPEA